MPDPVFDVRVDPTIHAQHPDYVALVLVATGLVNGPTEDGSDVQLAGAEAHVRSSGLDKATDYPHIAARRAAFSAYGAQAQPLPQLRRSAYHPNPQRPGAAEDERARRPVLRGERAPRRAGRRRGRRPA